MKYRSGTIILAIILAMTFSWNAVLADGKEDKSDSSEGDFLTIYKTSSGNLFENPSSFDYSFVAGTGYDQSSGFQYSQYFSYYPPEDIPEGPASFEIRGQEPDMLYFSGQAVPYSQYRSAAYTGANSIWIEGTNSWAQYAMIPWGSWLQLVITTSTSGRADFYEITPDGEVYMNNYWMSPYNRVTFDADEVGKHIYFFVKDNQPSNLVVIDVVKSGSSTPQSVTPISRSIIKPTPFPEEGDVSVTIKSENMRGYDVYVDDFYVGTDGFGGDARDGEYSLKVTGNKWHTVKAYDGQWFYGKSKYYTKKQSYILRVEPGSTIYMYGR